MSSWHVPLFAEGVWEVRPRGLSLEPGACAFHRGSGGDRPFLVTNCPGDILARPTSFGPREHVGGPGGWYDTCVGSGRGLVWGCEGSCSRAPLFPPPSAVGTP